MKANHHRFDVVDALAGALAGSKPLTYRGLLVARSVASHRLYDQFEASVRRRWPEHDCGTFAGRIFYSAVSRLLSRLCDQAIRHADLVNVANHEEAEFVEHGFRPRRVIVQPYGLTSENQRALSEAAAPAQRRLAEKKVCFLGMWGPRKGSRIWREIVRLVRRHVPDAQFVFLGTMVAPEVVRKDLGSESDHGVEMIPEFSPDNLPQLLSDCTAGGFPSYVEAFGLAILEQLAAGIPTVAFDQGGPRDILKHLHQLLVPVGDVEQFANALVRVLQLSPADYQRLSEQSVATACTYRWSDIAENTLAEYRLTSGSVLQEHPALR